MTPQQIDALANAALAQQFPANEQRLLQQAQWEEPTAASGAKGPRKGPRNMALFRIEVGSDDGRMRCTPWQEAQLATWVSPALAFSPW